MMIFFLMVVFTLDYDFLKQKRFKKIAWIQSHHLHFSENSNHWQERLLEVIRQNIAGWCNKLFVFKRLLTTWIQATFKNLLYFNLIQSYSQTLCSQKLLKSTFILDIGISSFQTNYVASWFYNLGLLIHHSFWERKKIP